MLEKIKVLTIMGTRPEIIRLSEIVKKLDLYTNHKVVFTNQSFDYEMSQVFFDELKIRKPDYTLDVKSETVGEQIGKILTQCEKVLLEEKPDAILILGDTNSALSCIIAKRLRIAVFHLEAGNRCFDERVPEEINRRIVDHTSDINMCYTEHARRNLLREGLATQEIFVVGSPLIEVYSSHTDEIQKSKILDTLHLKLGEYFLASFHREENVHNSKNLFLIISALRTLSEEYKLPVVLSTHPHTRKHLEAFNCGDIMLHPPFGMVDYIRLQRGALCTLSDSGTIHEDGAILGTAVVNIRDSNERPEAYDNGNVIMAGLDTSTILNAVNIAIDQLDTRFNNPYADGNCSDKVIRLIVGLQKIVKKRRYLC
ncbi:hypothetical protein LCGC14_0340990 [marine sediment metagenome]|uniref:UDP-N-acetylglucosamine 2-epimerase domain-containing protein n=1 Tax=marine sediment metagenome TaxID=412755 RepID=A0A0F9TWN0_9ZZZZ